MRGGRDSLGEKARSAPDKHVGRSDNKRRGLMEKRGESEMGDGRG